VETSASSLQEEVERRLEASEPDVEVLLVEQTAFGRAPALRVFLDRPGGVDHGLCVRATRQLEDLLRDYSIEVSSPGPSRPLTKPHHFERFVGRRVRVKLSEAIDGRSEFRGELTGAGEHSIELAGDWGTVAIPYESVRRANLTPQRPADGPRPPRRRGSRAGQKQS
jgi:ribosome maturation factor RimP